MRQQDLRLKLVEAMQDCLTELGMEELNNCFSLGDPEDPVFEKDIEKAMDMAYYSITDALKQISRLATRLGYIDKQQSHTQK